MRLLFILLFILDCASLPAQIVDDMEDESKLYAESKQINQFFRRFNGEEDESGKRYNPSDRLYRSDKIRKKYLGILFDEDNKSISTSLKIDFAKYVLSNESSFLDFHSGNWFSEVRATFSMNGKDQPVTLYMEIEKDHQGYKWVISKVYSSMYGPYFVRDTTKIGRFLHPMSHELDFMNLRKAFERKDSISQFTVKRFEPDHLSIFLYELKKGSLKFKFVNEVKFHFFQIEGWYFEISQFNRPGYNTGWLISNLVKLNNEGEKRILLRYLYNETR